MAGLASGDRDVEIEVGLPLPLDVAGGLLRGIGAVWPSARVRTDGPSSTMTVVVPGEDRDGEPAELDPSVLADGGGVPVPAGVDVDGFLRQLRDGTLGVSLPEWFARLMVGAMAATLEGADARNYVELSLVDPDGPGRYTVTVERPDGASPHELRAVAENRVAVLEAALEAAGVPVPPPAC